MHDQVTVWLEDADIAVGYLGKNVEDHPCFRYSLEYLSLKRNALPLSLSLPLTEKVYDKDATRAYFSNLLHESDYMRRKLDRAGIDPDDLVEVLSAIGKDCSGSVSCVPLGDNRPKRPGDMRKDYRKVTNLKMIVEELAHRREPPLKNVKNQDPSPIPGVQPKIALTKIDEGFALPMKGAPTTHILKVSPADDPSQSLVEKACLDFATAFGCETANAEITKIAGYNCLLLERFDRRIKNNHIYRIHQEDFAQALGMPARHKYERYGARKKQTRYNAVNIINLLRDTRRSAISMSDFFRLTMANLILGNTDNHAKNHSLLYDRGRVPRLAPAYDLVSIALDPNSHSELAFYIGKAKTFDALKSSDLVSFAKTISNTDVRARMLLSQELKRWQKIDVDNCIEEALEPLPTQLGQKLGRLWRARVEQLSELINDIG